MFKGAAFSRIAPFGVYMAFIMLADMLSRRYTVHELRWLYAVKILAVVLVLLCYRRVYTELREGWPSLRALALAVGAGALVFVLWIKLSASWMVIGNSAGFDPRDNGIMDWSMVAVRLAGAALVVPLMEELFWRSFLLRWMQAPDFLQVRPHQAGLRGFVVVAVLFGFEHNLWFAGIVAGAIYNLLYMRTGSLWTAILAHAVTNGLLGVWIISTGNWTYW